MIPRDPIEVDARRRLCGTRATDDPFSEIARGDPDKAAVMRWVAGLVADGTAEWDTLDNGNIRLRFKSGEIYLLADRRVVRVA
ncbi:hypothetical protein [Sphingomonas oligoaromativorans]|uniref:hypothetical protein n=1 Tax=Sphingomonas oligoaromativorans TaxID=575322 RepID=UPI0014219604|nr:hypothetical protein [Sphingomonas oligoaromativorans]NIJ33785.1 hypothetical protein [Sphingomonas oligoaromativorans]